MRRAAAALFLLFLACRTSQQTAHNRVVLVSFDGLGADELLRQHGLASFERMAREGVQIERVIPVNPTATAAAHVSMLTGAQPNITGIVANRFREPGMPAGDLKDAFMADIGAETLVEAAHRAGKRVASIAFPSVDGRNARRSADWGLAFVASLTKPRMISLHRSDFADCGGAVCATIDWLEMKKVEVRATDATDDGIENYDAIRFDGVAPDAAGWFAVSQRADGSLAGSWSKVMRFESGLNVTIYWGAISRNAAYPESFRRMIDDTVGFWPGQPDEAIDPQTFIEQNDRFTDFFTNATLATMRTTDFDLLLVYQSPIDKAGHPFFDGVPVQRAYAAADRSLGAIARELDPRRDTLVVTGDHGLSRIEKEIRLGRLVADLGFPVILSVAKDLELRSSKTFAVFAAQDDGWQTYGNGNVGHLYGNDRPDELADKLRATGFFERVERKTAQSHPNSGDIMLYSYPNIALSSAGGDVEAVVKPTYKGQHGGLNSHPQFHSTLFMWGRGIAPGRVAEERQTKIARMVSKLLGIDPPREAE